MASESLWATSEVENHYKLSNLLQWWPLKPFWTAALLHFYSLFDDDTKMSRGCRSSIVGRLNIDCQSGQWQQRFPVLWWACDEVQILAEWKESWLCTIFSDGGKFHYLNLSQINHKWYCDWSSDCGSCPLPSAMRPNQTHKKTPS
jgi:hypothetical protein